LINFISCVERFEGGLTKCTLRGRVNDTTYVNFKTKEEMLECLIFLKKNSGWMVFTNNT